ncbi:MAG: D-tyrosyl-tRNA(Tyr) deacylase [Clostridiales bacterium]|nr:MAG: D-tyrosyl-tRNA(Tyr) deacylase [Clostridiales bacterium]
MKAVLQRAAEASIIIDGVDGGAIGPGLVLLLGVMQGDTEVQADILAEKAASLRIFTDENDKMNRSVNDIDGDLLIVSNFTLGADCKKGRRPSFDRSAAPQEAEPLYEHFVARMRELCAGRVITGKFGADMKVSLVNDGPVTILLDTDFLTKR